MCETLVMIGHNNGKVGRGGAGHPDRRRDLPGDVRLP